MGKEVEDEISDLAGALVRVANGDAPGPMLDAAERLLVTARAATLGRIHEKLDLYTAAIAFNIALRIHGA